MRLELNKLYNYVFGDWADIEKNTKGDLTPETKAKFIAKKTQEIREFFVATKGIAAVLHEHKNWILARLLFTEGPSWPFPRYEFPDANRINRELNSLEETYGLLRNEKNQLTLQIKTLFHEYFSLAKLVADRFEFNNDRADSVAYLHAYKMLVIFGKDPKRFIINVDKYLEKHNYSPRVVAPLHDALIYPLPKIAEDKIHLDDWRKLIQKGGPRLFKLFNLAPAIEKHLHGRCPKNLKEAVDAAQNVRFKNAKENPELAGLFIELNLDEKLFEKALDVDKKRKHKDNLPSMTIHGSDIDAKYTDYHFVKLPINDPVAYVLGNLTNCCQHMGGHSEQCVIDGVTRENNGFYVLLKATSKAHEEKNNPLIDGKINYNKFEIVGQSYAWLSKQGNLVFDSWENKSPEREDKVITFFLEKFSQHIVQQKDSSIMRVMIGVGGKTPNMLKGNKSTYPEAMAEGKQYGDSQIQSTLFCDEILKNAYVADLRKEIHKTLTMMDMKNHAPTVLDNYANWLTEACYSKSYGTMIKSILTDKLITIDEFKLIYNFPNFKQISLEILIFLKQNKILTEANIHLLSKLPSGFSLAYCQALLRIKQAGFEINGPILEYFTYTSPPPSERVIEILSCLKEQKLEAYEDIQYTLFIHGYFKRYISAFKILNEQQLFQDKAIRQMIITAESYNAEAKAIDVVTANVKMKEHAFDHELRNTILAAKNCNSAYIAAICIKHEITNLPKEFNSIVLEADYIKIENLMRCIPLFKKADLLSDPEIRTKLICNNIDEKLAKEIIFANFLLRKSNLHNDKELKAIVLNSASPKGTAHAILLLKEAKLDNTDNRSKIINSSEPEFTVMQLIESALKPVEEKTPAPEAPKSVFNKFFKF